MKNMFLSYKTENGRRLNMLEEASQPMHPTQQQQQVVHN